MRIKFIKGKQRELIRDFRVENNLTWNKLAKNLNIPLGRLNTYYYETSLIPEEVYIKLDPEKIYSSFILVRLEDNWGKSKGGRISKGRIKKIKIPLESEELAEFYGIMLGDGCSQRLSFYKSRTDKRGVYFIKIVGDSRYDRNY